MGSKSDGGKGALISESRDLAERARQAIDKVNLPDIEKMKLQLEEDQLVGLLNAEETPDSELKNIQLDPRYQQAQLDALSEYERMSKDGLSLADRIGLDEINQSVANQDKARRDSILASMAERGALDSGEALAAQLQGAQASAQSAQAQGNELNKAMIQARRDALSNRSNLAGQMSQQDYGRQAEMAKSMDAINQFRSQNRQNVNQYNLGNKQQISSGNVNLRNTQQQYNKQLQQQDFENQMKKQGAIAGAYGNQSQNALQAASMAQGKAGLGGVIGTLAGAGLGYAATGDAKGASAGANIFGAAGSQMADGGIKPYLTPEQELAKKEDDDFVNSQLLGIASNLKRYADGGLRVDEAADMGLVKPNMNAQKELLAMARGDIMPEDSSGGRIIGGSSYSGDKLPDRINSGEMVFNLPQQHNIKEELDNKTAEVEGFRKLLRMIGKK